MAMHETDIRRLQGRDGIDKAWRTYENAMQRMQVIRERFNAAASYTQNERATKYDPDSQPIGSEYDPCAYPTET